MRKEDTRGPAGASRPVSGVGLLGGSIRVGEDDRAPGQGQSATPLGQRSCPRTRRGSQGQAGPSVSRTPYIEGIHVPNTIIAFPQVRTTQLPFGLPRLGISRPAALNRASRTVRCSARLTRMRYLAASLSALVRASRQSSHNRRQFLPCPSITNRPAGTVHRSITMAPQAHWT